MEQFIKTTRTVGGGRAFSGIMQFFLTGTKLTGTQRGVRFMIGLVQPVLSIADLLNRDWEIGLELVSIFMLVTSATGVCFAEKTWKYVIRFLPRT